MPDNIMSEYLRSSLDGIKSIAGMDTIIGKAISTPNGVTVIPVSKVTMGFASGSLDVGAKRIGSSAGAGGGGGTGVSITPVAFPNITPRLIPKLLLTWIIKTSSGCMYALTPNFITLDSPGSKTTSFGIKKSYPAEFLVDLTGIFP